MQDLIYDRTKADADKINALNKKGWEAMTGEERAWWLRGDVVELHALDGRLVCLDGALSCHNGIVRGAINAIDHKPSGS
jgi:hypothetical protein